MLSILHLIHNIHIHSILHLIDNIYIQSILHLIHNIYIHSILHLIRNIYIHSVLHLIHDLQLLYFLYFLIFIIFPAWSYLAHLNINSCYLFLYSFPSFIFKASYFILKSGDISSKANTWSISNTELKFRDRVLWIPSHIKSEIIKTVTNTLLSITRTTIPNLKLVSRINIKTLDSFKDNVRFFIFDHILSFRDKTNSHTFLLV